MGVTERLVRSVVATDVPLESPDLLDSVMDLAAIEAPLAGTDIAQEVVDALVGLGPLQALLRDQEVSDILVNGPADIWVERSGVLTRTDTRFPDRDAVVAAVERVIAPLGLRLDRSSPAVDARLPDGSRLHAVIPPAAVDGPVVAIRRFTEAVSDLEELVAVGAASATQVAYLAESVGAGSNIVVSGGTGSGKTTLLNLLSRSIPPHHRVVTVEDAAELRLTGHVVRLEGRPSNSEGAGAIGLQELVKHALRLRPDRIIVGEVRGPEALDMIQAMTTGHDGSMSTVHASSPSEALLRLETLALSGERRVSDRTVRRQLHEAVDLIVQVKRVGAARSLSEIARVAADGSLALAPC